MAEITTQLRHYFEPWPPVTKYVTSKKKKKERKNEKERSKITL